MSTGEPHSRILVEVIHLHERLPMSAAYRTGLLLVLLSAVGYSFFSIFTKTIYEGGLVNPLDILVWRFVLATPFIWIGVAGRGLLPQKRSPVEQDAPMPRLRLLAMGLLTGVVAMSAFFALERLPVSLYTVLIYTYPAMVAIGAVYFGERLGLTGWMALAATLLGAVLLLLPGLIGGFTEIDPLGVVLVFINALTYSLYILLSSRFLRGVRDQAQASAWNISGALLFVLVVLLIRGVNLPPSLGVWAALIGLALISTAIPIFSFYAGMQQIGPARAAIISTIELVLTLVWAMWLRNEVLGMPQIIGAVLVMGSVVLLQLTPALPVNRTRTPAEVTS
jgi:drug/metabolite transporter (DMT)-like permease